MQNFWGIYIIIYTRVIRSGAREYVRAREKRNTEIEKGKKETSKEGRERKRKRERERGEEKARVRKREITGSFSRVLLLSL